jgi:hypothetical protein
MSLAHWQTIIERINQTHGTQFGSDDVAPMLRFLVEKLGNHRKASDEVGVTRATVSFRLRRPDISPKPRAIRVIPKPAVAPIDLAKWRQSGMHRPPCEACPIGRGTKNRPECENCVARIEYANAQAGMPAIPGADSMQQVQYMRQTRMSACI